MNARGLGSRVTVLALPVAMLLVFTALLAWGAKEGADVSPDYGVGEARKLESAVPKRWITADHSKHEILQREFHSGPEVTAACLSCHNDAADQFRKTIHWSWICPQDPNKVMGKYGLTLNNFCIAVPSNEPRCTSCHAGFGWKDKTFMHTAGNDQVDCLVCHDRTGTYKKFPSAAGNPVSEPTEFEGKQYLPPDWNKVAQQVGRPGRDNCGNCHFYGGGGDAVKHGDLDSSLFTPAKALDVHMAADGANFDCVRCHTTEAHAIAGRCYKHPASEDPTLSLIDDDQIKRITCVACHTTAPHKPGHKANDHTDKVACQTCHIPEFARGGIATKMVWDWSTAGDKTRKSEEQYGRKTYDPKKGDFVWEVNVQPEYRWFNGTMNFILVTDTIDPSAPVQVNSVVGSRDDPNSRIYPFKVHRGKTPYDKGNNTMVIPHLFPTSKDDSTAYWKNFDWTKAIQHGQDYVGLPFSGEVGFVDTEYSYPTTHMVAPKDNVVACVECHSSNGRLAGLHGFYMPGRDYFPWLDTFGWVLVLGSMVGVLGHGFLRMLSGSKKG